MDCFRWARKEVRTAPFPKAKEYQKHKVGGNNQEQESELEIELYTTDEEESDMSEEDSPEEEHKQCSEDSEAEEDFEENQGPSKEQESEYKRNWWDSDSVDKQAIFSLTSQMNILTYQSMIGRPFLCFIFPSEDDWKIETTGQ